MGFVVTSSAKTEHRGAQTQANPSDSSSFREAGALAFGPIATETALQTGCQTGIASQGARAGRLESES